MSNLTFTKEKGVIPRYNDSTVFSLPDNRFAYLSLATQVQKSVPTKGPFLEFGKLPAEICRYFGGSTDQTANKVSFWTLRGCLQRRPE
jgi:hypothetical protein